ncbi:cysteine peptidase family C39 domain-containing protein [bacterium]|nr:cysteine peptidase family C39 domain-containing protein [bacterium]
MKVSECMDASVEPQSKGFSRRSALFRLAVSGILAQPAITVWNAANAEENPFATKAPIRNDARDFRVFPKNRKELSREDIVMQRRDFSCGAAALATVFKYYWREAATEELFLTLIARRLSREELMERIRNGLSLTDLKNAAIAVKYSAVIGRLTLEKLADSKLPLIVGITVNNYDHFVVVRGVVGDYIYLADPIYGKQRIPLDVFAERWQENAILAIIKPGAKPMKTSPLFVTPYEASLGKLNNLVIRNQITGNLFP